MKQNSRLTIVALVLTAVSILFLAIRNDSRFNDDRKVKTSEIASRDSIEYEQMDSISATLNNVIIQLDSIENTQKEYEGNVISDMDSIKQLLKNLGRTESQILNLIK